MVPSARWIGGRLFFPLKGTTFEFIDQANDENEGKKHHRPKDWNSCSDQIAMSENPWNEEDHIDVEQYEKHCSDVKFHGVAGFSTNFWSKTTFVGRILDFTVSGFLTKKVTANNIPTPIPKARRICSKTGRYSGKVTINYLYSTHFLGKSKQMEFAISGWLNYVFDVKMPN